MKRRYLILSFLTGLRPVLRVSRVRALSDLNQQLTRGMGVNNRATFSPDGQTIYFTSKRTGHAQVFAMGLDGTNVRQVLTSSANDSGRYAFSPDGKQMAFSSDRSGQSAVYVLDLTNRSITLISAPEFFSFGPSWSEQGKIAFFSHKGGNELNIWMAAPDGSHAKQLTNLPGSSRQPWWSPDGQMLAFAANRAQPSSQIYVMHGNGTGLLQLTSSGDNQQPFWSPDGKQIAFASNQGDGFRIYVMQADGSRMAPIPQPRGKNLHPAWSPDGKHLVFTSDASGKDNIYLFTFKA